MTAHQTDSPGACSAPLGQALADECVYHGRYLRDKAKSVAATGGSCIEYADSVEGVA